MSIEVNCLRKQYGDHTAVDGITFTVADGEFFVLLGPSGCGKTTTLRMIAGLEVLTEGTIRIKGKDVTHAEPRHREIAMAFQDYGLYPNMTVYRNIEFPLKIRKVNRSERRDKVLGTAQRLGISPLLDRKPARISGGEKQRVSLARALVRSPHAFLMDEPLSNLDAKLRASMRTEIKQLVTNLKITTIYVTHDQVEAMSMADRIAVMDRGTMVQIGSPLDVYDRPSCKFVAEFIGSPPMNLLPAQRTQRGSIVCAVQPIAGALLESELARSSGSATNENELFVGVRPEHLSLNDRPNGNSFPAVVDFIEPLGQTTNVYVKYEGVSLVIATDRFQARTGDEVSVGVDARHVLLISG